MAYTTISKYSKLRVKDRLVWYIDRMTLEGLSREAKQRQRWMEHFKKYRNARLTCRHFGISPDTFYLWKRRYEQENPATLEDTASRRPKRLRNKM